MNLEELPVHIRNVMPAAKTIQVIEKLSKANAVKFKCHKKEFIVRSNLQTFELKRGKDLFITGMSSLIQSILASKTNIDKSIEDIKDGLEEAEKCVTRGQVTKGMIALEPVKQILHRLLKISPV